MCNISFNLKQRYTLFFVVFALYVCLPFEKICGPLTFWGGLRYETMTTIWNTANITALLRQMVVILRRTGAKFANVRGDLMVGRTVVRIGFSFSFHSRFHHFYYFSLFSWLREVCSAKTCHPSHRRHRRRRCAFVRSLAFTISLISARFLFVI